MIRLSGSHAPQSYPQPVETTNEFARIRFEEGQVRCWEKYRNDMDFSPNPPRYCDQMRSFWYGSTFAVSTTAMRNTKTKSEKLVLVVDDDPSVRRSTSRLLKTHGFSVIQADNGQSALDALKQMRNSPCLVVLDMAMPVMDGLGFLKLRAQDPLLRDIPVVVVSGSPQTGEPIEGISGYLCKPLNVERLIDLVHQHC